MNEPRSRVPNSQGPGRSVPRRTWLRPALGFVVFGIAAILCARVIAQYLETRPTDYRDYAAGVVEFLHQYLADQQVPAENVRQSDPQIQMDDGAVWRVYGLDIDLPDGMACAAFVPFLEEKLRPANIAASTTTLDAYARQIQCSVDGRVFLTLHIQEKPREDLTDACRKIADEVRIVLRTQGIASETPNQEPREDARRKWTFSRIDAWDVPPDLVAKLESMMQNAITQRDAHVATRIGIRGLTSLLITHATVPCCEIVVHRGDPQLFEADLAEDPIPRLTILAGQGPDPPPTTCPSPEELPLDSTGLEDMELGRKLTGAKPPADVVPKVAIVVDDGGYGGPVSEKILALNPGLTLAILPGATHGTDVIRQAEARGFEIILHMPMDNARLASQLVGGMRREEMARRFERALADVPGAVGVNNHMGSKFTANRTAVNAFLSLFKDRPLYFVDSRTTPQSRAFETARNMGIPCATRDVFLDHHKDANYIIGQFNHLMAVAKEQGCAVGICHFRPTTAQVLAQMLPQLERNGILLVHASEIVK